MLGYKTDPTARHAWWREQNQVQEVEEEVEEEVQQEEPPTPAVDVNGLLCQLCHQNKLESGKNYVSWRSFLTRLRQ